MSALEIALQLAGAGLPVFPCGRNKRPAIGKTEGGRGFLDATTDEADIRRMFNRESAILVGVPTGDASGVDVLDFDYKHGAAEWEQENLYRLPETCVHQTQSGGRHMLFRHVVGICNSASVVASGVDVRGQGGYIIAPPSPGYKVINRFKIAHWPDWLLPLVLPKPKPEIARTTRPVRISNERAEHLIKFILSRVRDAGAGGKHFALRNAAYHMGGIADAAGISDADATQWLLDALPSGVECWDAAKKTVASGLLLGRNHPLSIEHSASPEARRDLARIAFRLIRMGVSGSRVIQSLYEINNKLDNPLPPSAVTETALWAASRSNAR